MLFLFNDLKNMGWEVLDNAVGWDICLNWIDSTLK